MNILAMIKKIHILFFLLLLSFTIWAQDTTFEKANNAYKEGKYDEAISLYKELSNSDKQSATVFYNLGNAYFKKSELANALLNYERAYRLQPSDKDIKNNLNFAYAQIADKIKTPKHYFITKWIYKTVYQLHSNTWAYLGIAFWTFAFLAILLFTRTASENMRKLFFFITLLSIFAAFFTFYAAYSQYNTNKSETYAIVFAQNITIKSTPSNNGTDLFILHEGTKVQVLDKVGAWYKIELADKREGWIPAKEITQI